MEPAAAAQHLQVIRTLMERSALYRRALAPIMISAGILGLTASAVGEAFKIQQCSSFIGFWYAVGTAAVIAALLLTRRQALRQGEPFWSPPTRRVVQAMLPPLVVGFLIGAIVFVVQRNTPVLHGEDLLNVRLQAVLPGLWAALYGCAMHAAGFYTTRGMRLFAWVIAALGCLALFIAAVFPDIHLSPHLQMGFFFGVMHIAYGAYLYVTERGRTGT